MKSKPIISKIAALVAGSLLLVGCAKNSTNDTEPGANQTKAGTDIVACTMTTDAGCYMAEPIFPDGSVSFTYVDYATNQRIFLCSNPNCNHQNETCTSYVPSSQWTSSACVIKDHLYISQNETHNNTPPHIDVWDKDGSNRRQLVQFPESWKLVFDVEFGQVYHDEENMYLMVNVPAENDYVVRTLISVNFHTGDYKILYEAEDYNPTVKIESAVGRRLLLSTSLWGDKYDIGATYRWFDVDTGEFEDFMQYDSNSYMGQVTSEKMACNISNGNIFCDADDSTRILRYCDLNTQEWKETGYAQVPIPTEKMVSDVIGVGHLLDDYFLISCDVEEGTEHQWIQYALDAKTGEFWPYQLHKTNFPSEGVGIEAEHNGKLLVCYDWEEVSVRLPDGTTVPNWFPLYGWMTKEDYVHGNPVYEPIETDVYAFCH